jgi:UDP-N-acetylmuramate dehydrogenase
VNQPPEQLVIEREAPIPTWFGIGGGADRLARPRTHEQVRECVRIDAHCRVLGEGANLLVDDDGVGELVVETKGMRSFEVCREERLVRAQSGADLAKLIHAAVREGMAGLEVLSGIPATVGGAVVMNAGGRFGEIGPRVERVRGVSREGRDVELAGGDIPFGYRRSGLGERGDGLIITEVELRLESGDPEALRERFKEIMGVKKDSQPLADRSAGCIFKNPTLEADLDGIGRSGERVGAGLLIDRAGCKGMRVGGRGGGASVSARHANFIVVERATDDRTGAGRGASARAGDVIALMERVVERVRDRFGVVLEPEVVVWRRS